MSHDQVIAEYREKLRAIRETEFWEARKQNHAMRNILWAFNYIQDLFTGGQDAGNTEHRLSGRTGT